MIGPAFTPPLGAGRMYWSREASAGRITNVDTKSSALALYNSRYTALRAHDEGGRVRVSQRLVARTTRRAAGRVGFHQCGSGSARAHVTESRAYTPMCDRVAAVAIGTGRPASEASWPSNYLNVMRAVARHCMKASRSVVGYRRSTCKDCQRSWRSPAFTPNQAHLDVSIEHKDAELHRATSRHPDGLLRGATGLRILRLLPFRSGQSE